MTPHEYAAVAVVGTPKRAVTVVIVAIGPETTTRTRAPGVQRVVHRTIRVRLLTVERRGAATALAGRKATPRAVGPTQRTHGDCAASAALPYRYR